MTARETGRGALPEESALADDSQTAERVFTDPNPTVRRPDTAS